jgi:hypothetical protein
MLKNCFLLFVVLLINCGCSTTTKIAALQPEPDNAAPLQYESTTSFINLPITIKLKDIENLVNKNLNGLIYEDNKIEDDNYTVKVWKLAPITLVNENNKIQTVLPLKAQIMYRYGIEKLGIALYDTREINLNGKIYLASEVGLTNWKLKTATSLASLEWNESPSIVIAGKSVPVTYLIKPAISIFKSKIEKKIDETVEKSMDFKPNVLEALGKICNPILLNPEYETWLRIVPMELYTTDAQLKKETVSFQMGLKCIMETLIGSEPKKVFDSSKITLKAVTKMPDEITANIIAVSTYEDASRIMTKNFLNKEFGSGTKKVTVKNVNLWHKKGKMVIALDLTGSLNGTIYLYGMPQYNDTTKEIYFDQLDYAIDTKNKLIKTASWLASGYVLKKLQETCRYSIKPNLDEGKQNILKYVTNYSPMPGVVTNGRVADIEFQKIQLTNKAIVAFLLINAKMNITIDGLK